MFWDGFRNKYSDVGLLLFRVVVGLAFLLHGLLKFGVGSDLSFGSLPILAQVGGIIEVVVGLLVIPGLFTAWAGFIGAGEMAVAYWTGHAFSTGSFWNPLSNGGELAALFAFAFLLLFFLGAGKWSLDAKLRKA